MPASWSISRGLFTTPRMCQTIAASGFSSASVRSTPRRSPLSARCAASGLRHAASA
jgi:hypothetical protein